MRTSLWLSACFCLLTGLIAASKTPNIVFIITDDQDAKLGSLDYMPLLNQYVTTQGTQYLSHYCTVSLCCPSRVSLWTGKAAHNTNVTDIVTPYGGYPKFVEGGWNDNWFPVWVQEAGFNTYYVGKLMNSYAESNYMDPYVNGLTDSRLFLDPWTYLYFSPAIQANKDKPVVYEGNYTNDLVHSIALELIDEAVAADKPFVVVAAPVGPHSSLDPKVNYSAPPQPADRHAKLFPNATVPRTTNFNPDVPSGANWVKELYQMGEDQVNYNDYYYRRRVQTLQSIDEMVQGIVESLDFHGILNNTFVIFTSDNGYHIGQHRLPPGKVCGYEEDINVPLIIRGPGVPKGETVNVSTTHTDLAPTMLQMMGLSISNHSFDGFTIPYTASHIAAAEASRTRHEHINIEFWGTPSLDGNYTDYNWSGVFNTYKGVRVVAQNYSFYYQVWCDNERELYDMRADPGQMENLINSTAALLGRPTKQVINRLDALLLVLKSCAEETCQQPWNAMQPGMGVWTLKDAMNATFDAFYASQPKVAWTECDLGYIISAEGPQWDTDGKVYKTSAKRHPLLAAWPEWT